MIKYLRKDLWDLKPYDANQQECKYKLDANENPWDLPEKIRAELSEEILKGMDFNQYPDSDARELKKAIARYCNVDAENIIVGSGSDELIHIITSAFVEKEDTVLCPTPSFGMYKIFTKIAGGTPIEVPLDQDYKYQTDVILEMAKKYNPKIIFLCTPNNPTGNSIPFSDIKTILNTFSGIVVIDEAYIEFAGKSMAEDILKYSNGIVLRTFSKAMGLAGLRIGYSICNTDLALQIYRVKPPYNLNTFSQKAAILSLENIDIIQQRISYIKEQRKKLIALLNGIEGIHTYPTESNFILIRVPDGDKVYNALLEQGILVRNFSNHPLLENCLRITVGDEHANDALYRALKEIIPTYISNLKRKG